MATGTDSLTPRGAAAATAGFDIAARRRAAVRLRTLIRLRWLALAGQTAALVVAERGFGLDLPLGLCLLAIAASAALNLVASFSFPATARLGEAQNLGMLLFDLAQLCLLLFLTGGMSNPFAVLVLGPVVVAATVLGLRATVIVGAAALGLVALLAVWNLPLRTETGEVLVQAPIFVLGNWAAVSIAIVFLALYARSVISEINDMTDALAATQMALARAQKLTDLGGVVAAAAHELGTPLATIKLTSAELAAELPGLVPDRPDLAEDARLIREQADRCSAILRSMGRAGKDDSLTRRAPLSELIREAAEPHMDRGRIITFDLAPEPGAEGAEPEILRAPEIIHGLRNLIQNAVDFASSRVTVEARWNDARIRLRIRDDGPGFPPGQIGEIGNPFLRPRRASGRSARPGYEGLGLGLFIAKTLLERTGAELTFANAGANAGEAAVEREQGRKGPIWRGGAIVVVEWPRAAVADAAGAGRRPAEPNRPIEA